MLRFLTICTLTLLPAFAQAQVIRENNIVVRVAPLTATTFEVFDGLDFHPRSAYCGAAIYAKRKYGTDGGDIWLARGLGPSETIPGRRSVVFSLDPVPNEFKSVSLSLRKAGQVTSFALANSFCYNTEFRVRVREVR